MMNSFFRACKVNVSSVLFTLIYPSRQPSPSFNYQLETSYIKLYFQEVESYPQKMFKNNHKKFKIWTVEFVYTIIFLGECNYAFHSLPIIGHISAIILLRLDVSLFKPLLQVLNAANKLFLLFCQPGVVPELDSNQKKGLDEGPLVTTTGGSSGMGSMEFVLWRWWVFDAFLHGLARF